MSKKSLFSVLVILILGFCIPVVSAEALPGQSVYLFSFFGEQDFGLRFAYSRDLYNWTEIPGPHLAPKIGDGIMRDPFVAPGPDGMFHMVWTTGWGRRDIGYASSPDLVNWSQQRLIPVMEHKQKARNCWAPKLFYEEASKQWMIIWSTWLDDGTFGPPELPHTSKQHRIFYVTTKDFKEFSQAKLLFNPGYSCIDAYLLKNSDDYLLFFKDERGNDAEDFNPEWQNVRFARSKSPYGPFESISKTITGKGAGTWHNEGPSAIKVSGQYYVFYDHHNVPRPEYYGAVKSADLSEWVDVSDKMHFPDETKHGHIFRAPYSVVEGLLNKGQAGKRKADAEASDGKSFRFTLTGDPRSSIERWAHTLDQITDKVGDEGAFHITAGDYFEDDHSTLTKHFYKTLKAEFGDDVIWYPGVGNHEVQREQYDLLWIRLFYYDELKGTVNPGPEGCEETTYSWDYENAHFVQLNMYWDGEKYDKDLGFTDALLEWLENDLDKNTKPVVFVIYHEPAWPNDRGGKESPKNWRRFMKLLNDRKVVAGLCAHTHKYARYQVEGDWEKFTWEIDAGNAGRMSHADKYQTFVDITVNSNGLVEFDTWQGEYGQEFRKTDSWTASVDIPAAVMTE
jgi:hypothetical protein